MGAYDIPAEQMKTSRAQSGSQIVVVASPMHIAGLQSETSAGALDGLTLVPVSPAEPIDDEVFAHASLAVVEVDPDDAVSIDRIGAVRKILPDLPVVAAIEGASLSLVRTLVRQGVADVVALPFDIAELLQVSLDTAAEHGSSPRPDRVLAPLIAVARSIGGCGTTSIATQLAADMAQHESTGRGVVVVDLDLQFGSVGDFLGVAARGSIADLLDAGKRLDEELVRSIAGEAAEGLSVIAAPESIMPLESVDADSLLQVIRLLRRTYGCVVLDLPANWTNWTLSAAAQADGLLLVVELSVASLRQAKRSLELFRSVGIDEQIVAIVANRVEKRLFRTIDLNDVSRTLGHAVLGSIALEAPAVSNAQNQGKLVSRVQGKSRFVADIGKVGALLRENFAKRSQ